MNEDHKYSAVAHDYGQTGEDSKSGSMSHQWYDQYSADRMKIYETVSSTPMEVPATGIRRLRRSSSSYPDLREEQFSRIGDGRFRSCDDFEINKYRSESTSDYVWIRKHRSEIEQSEAAKVIPVDTFVVRPTTSPSPPPPPPPPPPPALVAKRTYQSVRKRETPVNNRELDREIEEIRTPPAPPPPPPPPMMYGSSEIKLGNIGRRKSNTTKEIKSVLASLYNQSKLKRKRKTKNVDLHQYYSTVRPPPPPPPPPPQSVFQSLFKKKSKKVHSVSSRPPPPPPPPQSTKRTSNRKSHLVPPPQPPPLPKPRYGQGRPPLPTRSNTSYNYNNGSQSPLIPMAPPPPPPPFKMKELKFVVRGDFARIHSNESSRCSSPELDEQDLSTSAKSNTVDGCDDFNKRGPVFCPSPDVNAKAATFIARLRDGWKLEKLNSVREKSDMGSGPDPMDITF